MKFSARKTHILGFWVLLLLLSLVACEEPQPLSESERQCREGVNLFIDEQFDAALPLLEQGYGNRENAVFSTQVYLGECATAIGFIRQRNNDAEGALEPFAHSISVFEEHNEPGLKGVALNGLGEAYIGLSQYEEAFTALEEALPLIEMEGDLITENSILNNMGLVYLNQGHHVEAMDKFEEALSIAQDIDDLVGEAIALTNMGEVYRAQAKHMDALTKYHEVLTISQELEDRVAEGIALNNIAQVYHFQGRFDKALSLLQDVLTIMQEEEDKYGEATVIGNIGLLLLDMGQPEDALTMLQESLSISQDLGDRSGEGVSLINIGEVYRSQARFDEAHQIYEGALSIFRDIGEPINEAIALHSIGQAFHAQGHFEEALLKYREAFNIWQEFNHKENLGRVHNNIGQLYTDQGHYDDALIELEKSLAIQREINNRLGEGEALSNIGLVYVSKGQYANALQKYQEALSNFAELGIRSSEGIALGNIGLVYDYQGRYEEALEFYLAALTIHREVGNRVNEAIILNNIGLIYLAQNKVKEGETALEDALLIMQEIGNQAQINTILGNREQIYIDPNQWREELATFEKILATAREVGSLSSEATALNYIGDVYLGQERYADALKVYQDALTISRRLGDQLGEGIALNNIGLAYELSGGVAQALFFYEKSLDVLDTVRAGAGSEGGRTSFYAQYALFNEEVVSLYHQQGQDAPAFFNSERGRARAFLDTLSTGYIALSDDETAVLRDHEQTAYAEIQALQDDLVQAYAIDPLDPEQIEELKSQLQEAEKAHDAILKEIEDYGGQLATLIPGRNSVLTLAETQAILDAESTLVYYVVLEAQTLVFVITNEAYEVVEIPVSRADLSNSVSHFRDLVNFKEPELTRQNAQVVYQLLFEPFDDLLQTDNLIIVPHNALHYLPFAALRDADTNQYLIEQFSLTVLPSASALPFILANATDQKDATAMPLVLGNPATGNADLTNLNDAQQEAAAIARLFDVTPLKGTRAMESTVREKASQVSILHLAAHGQYDVEEPLDSTIYLAPDVGVENSGEEGNGRLQVHEIYSLDLNQADLVVLSACQTQLGELSAGDELVGLTRAFFFAGTPSVVATLWNVDDKATGILMTRFYTHLNAGMSKTEALRQAQLDLLAEKDDPFYWAGFVLSGDGGEIRDIETPFRLTHTARVLENSLLILTWILLGGLVFWIVRWLRRQ